jgi:tRNA(adenine34) deaminase
LGAAVGTRASAANEFVAAAFRMKEQAIAAGDQAYGAVIVQAGAIVGWGPSRVRELGEWVGHAERVAMRDAQRRIGREDLSGCAMYSTSRPCGTCERAAAQAKLARMYYGPDATDAGAPR